MEQFELTSDTHSHYGLAINGIIILESVLEKNKVEWDNREGYIEHLTENAENSYAAREKEVVKTLDEMFILISRNSLGAQEMIHPHSAVFSQICEKLISESL